MKEKGMKGAKMPNDHHEKAQGKLGHTSNMKYTQGLDNAKDLDKNNEGLASYAKKHKMKY